MFNGGLLTFFWYMLVIYFFVMVIWMFISVFADIFRRENLSAWGKAGWIFLIFIVPFLGILIYVIVRPKNTEQDQRMMARRRQRRRGWSAVRPSTTSPRPRSSSTRARSRRPSSTAIKAKALA